MASAIRTRWLTGTVLGAALAWGYWPTLNEMAARWANDPKYSHGYLVPLFAAWLLWRRRGLLRAQQPETGSWLGLIVLLIAFALHSTGSLLYLDWLADLSFLAALAGLVLCVGGGGALRWAGPSIAFLVFMLPLPYRAEVSLAVPLQELASSASTYLLQMIGLTAAAEGNRIVLGKGVVDVVEACSGLGMMVTFFAMATAMAIIIDRPLLDKLIVVVSAVPVALLANVIRIATTAIVCETIGYQQSRDFYHGPAGLLMAPLALGMLWIELKILGRLLVEVPPEKSTDYGFLPQPPLPAKRKDAGRTTPRESIAPLSPS